MADVNLLNNLANNAATETKNKPQAMQNFEPNCFTVKYEIPNKNIYKAFLYAKRFINLIVQLYFTNLWFIKS